MVFEFCKCNSASEIYPRFYSLLDAIRTVWAGPTQPARKPVKFVAFLSQIPPSGPSLPVVPVYNHCTVNNLRFWTLHGMEEVIGSIPFKVNCGANAFRPRYARTVITEGGVGQKSDQNMSSRQEHPHEYWALTLFDKGLQNLQRTWLDIEFDAMKLDAQKNSHDLCTVCA